MIAEIAAVATGIANAAKALKGILDSVQDAKTREKIGEIQNQLPRFAIPPPWVSAIPCADSIPVEATDHRLKKCLLGMKLFYTKP
jgi:hypothetical protein